MINVVMTCYFPDDAKERQVYASQALDSLLSGLCCTKDELRLVVADDSEQVATVVPYLLSQAGKFWHNESLYSRSYHTGIGASLNTALGQLAASDLWMYTTDDWLLTNKLCLDGPAHLLRNNEYSLVRLGPVHPDLHCVTRFQEGLGWWLDLEQHYGGFAFATRPFLAAMNLVHRVGPFNERLNSYETERLYAERVAKLPIKLAYWGGVDLAGPWEHLGLVEVGYRDV